MFFFTLNQLITASMMCKFKRNHANHFNVEHPHNHRVTRTQMMTSRDTLQGTAARFQRMEPLHPTHGQQRERQRWCVEGAGAEGRGSMRGRRGWGESGGSVPFRMKKRLNTWQF
jgi:hypothetical protein